MKAFKHLIKTLIISALITGNVYANPDQAIQFFNNTPLTMLDYYVITMNREANDIANLIQNNKLHRGEYIVIPENIKISSTGFARFSSIDKKLFIDISITYGNIENNNISVETLKGYLSDGSCARYLTTIKSIMSLTSLLALSKPSGWDTKEQAEMYSKILKERVNLKISLIFSETYYKENKKLAFLETSNLSCEKDGNESILFNGINKTKII